MCPSYMVTKEEEHTTRGRAHLLFDMVQGNTIREGWKSEAVKESLDLCLSCKGCKGDCPVQVDVATMKAEFLSHYYAGKSGCDMPVPLGLIHLWARAASHFPLLANFLTQMPGISDLVKQLGGIAPERHLPPFAETFQDWFRKRGSQNPRGRRYFCGRIPSITIFIRKWGKATVEVLENAGCHVLLQDASLCCGRPLYDYGFLRQAKRQLTDILDKLDEPIHYGIPVVGMEPSCLSVFRDELKNLLPKDERAKKLSEQTFMPADFLEHRGYQPPKLGGRALVQGHCHEAAIFGLSREMKLLEKMGIHAKAMDSGCCGRWFLVSRRRNSISSIIGHPAMVPKIEDTLEDSHRDKRL